MHDWSVLNMRNRLILLTLRVAVLIASKTSEGNNRHDLRLLTEAFRDIAIALPTSHIGFVFDTEQDENIIHALTNKFFAAGLMSTNFVVTANDTQTTDLESLSEDVKKRISLFSDAVYFIIAEPRVAEDVLEMIKNENLARRNIVFAFFTNDKELKERFFLSLQEAMRVCLILNPRYGIFQVLYNQFKSNGIGKLHLVNWWSEKKGIFRFPLLPAAKDVYKNFNGRTFNIPVLHKPPWNFVRYMNDNTIIVEGGRDDRLLRILSHQLNFKYKYFDPPDRSQGSAVVNGTMQGVLGLIWQREVEFFIGDLTVTYERSLVVDFTFLTLTDSEAFITHAPGRLNEALALIRPFQWKVWPAVAITFLLTGPLLYILLWTSSIKKNYHFSLLCDSIWTTTSIFLKQSTKIPMKIYRIRFFLTFLSLVSTYVIGDVYSANLMSMLAKPTREKPVSNLEELNSAMETRNFRLLVEKYSASHTVLENGTGLYKSIWEKMKSQGTYLLDSTEDGMMLVRDQKNVALMGGRETFIYDTLRFGVHHFYLSEKLYTRYSAIALQTGCPFIHNFNDVLIHLFEAGVLNKITEDEYQKLEKKTFSIQDDGQSVEKEANTESDSDDQMKAMSMITLQGAFYVLLAGHLVSSNN